LIDPCWGQKWQVACRRLFYASLHLTVCCSLVRHRAESGSEIKNRASGFPLSHSATVTVLAFAAFSMHFAHGLAVSQPVKRAANSRVTDSGFKKKL